MRAHDPSRARLRRVGPCVGSTDGRADRQLYTPIVRVDLIGHGLSPKPMRGYSMPDQVEAICRSLDHLAVAARVVAVGHSGGGDVVVEMIRRHPPRVAGALLLGTPPTLSYVNLPVAARIISEPLLGYLVWRSITDAMIRRSLAQTFAPGFDANPAVCAPFVEDLRMTHSSYVAARATFIAGQQGA